jgi:uncharacterized protein YndB with AHSA1/START domain
MAAASTDRIEKEIVLRAPQSRVWRALTDAREFGAWFRVDLHGPFEEGKKNNGQITYPGWEWMTMVVWVEKIEPETYFSMRWHPSPERGVDYSDEPPTLIEFRLEPAAGGGPVLKVSESGFDALPAHSREAAFAATPKAGPSSCATSRPTLPVSVHHWSRDSFSARYDYDPDCCRGAFFANSE